MKKNKLAVLTSCLVLSGTFCTQAQNKTPQEIRIPDTYKLTNKSIYRNGWIDFNKNGKKDVYEDPTVPIDARVEDLLSQMNVEEKTCQMVTLYGSVSLEFLGLNERALVTENDLEQSILDNLQRFLLEMGHGFCFEEIGRAHV